MPNPSSNSKTRSASGRSSTSGSRQPRTRRRKSGFLAVLVELIGLTYFGRVFLVLLLAGVLGLLNILVSSNQYETFFLLCGIEIGLATIVIWLRFIFRRHA